MYIFYDTVFLFPVIDPRETLRQKADCDKMNGLALFNIVNISL